MERLGRALAVLLLSVGLLAASAATAVAQSEPEITTPPTQTAVPVDEPFEVTGSGCPPGSEVEISASEDIVVTTTADDGGAFSATITVPASLFDFDHEIPDVNEFNLRGTCDGQTFGSGVLVPETPQDEQVDQVPAGGVETGAGGAVSGPSTAGSVALLLALGGLMFVGLRRGRRQPS